MGVKGVLRDGNALRAGWEFYISSKRGGVPVFAGPMGEKTLAEMSGADLLDCLKQATVIGSRVPPAYVRMVRVEVQNRKANEDMGSIEEEAGW